MSNKPNNSGIIVSGGTFKSDVAAAGEGAQASQHVSNQGTGAQGAKSQEVWELLGRLQTGVTSGQYSSQERQELAAAARGVADELAKGNPNEMIILALLDRMAHAAGAASNLKGEVAVLKKAVAGLLEA